MNKSEAYQQGYNAGRNATTNWIECPYDYIYHKDNHGDWQRGFADGERDRRLTRGTQSYDSDFVC